MEEEEKLYLIKTHLSAFVPLEIAELRKQGGPGEWQRERAAQMAGAGDLSEQDWKAWSQRTYGHFNLPGTQGDTLLYGGQPGAAASVMGQLVEALAILAFQPGGVAVFGLHFDERGECMKGQKATEAETKP